MNDDAWDNYNDEDHYDGDTTAVAFDVHAKYADCDYGGGDADENSFGG